ncbi:MAG: 16S rRNA (cytosine(967)-C(5))-methyltransferase RsmB [Rhodocyclaceae bacterium]|nr:MAG: 16S rRNA (cytosine(967)-C(5))-methyltransferase RsmB [Rhodocyclaceae bacterium]
MSSSPRPRRSVSDLPEDSLAYALRCAAEGIAAVFRGRNLDVALAALHLPPAVRPTVMDLVYGTLRAYGRGDFFLARLMPKPLQDQETRALLQVALYRLERRGDDAHTTVDQAVHAAARIAGGRFRALVNAVLRNFLRRQEELQAAADTDDVACWQHPLWWIEALRRAYPDTWQTVLAAGNLHPPMSLRVNLRRGRLDDYLARLAAAEIAARPWGEAGILLEKPVAVDKLPGFFDGLVSVQDWGAQRAARLLDVGPGLRVLDACAAPGGKTAHLLELAEVALLALDAEPKRAARVVDNLARLGLQAEVKTADCRVPATWWDGRPFDRILADVPCSASGVVRRHPDAKVLRRAADVKGFAATQKEILEALWPLLAPGGTMLYCTCSVFPEENGQQVAAFLTRHADAHRIALEQQPELQLLPNADHDGFYYALLQKRAP